MKSISFIMVLALFVCGCTSNRYEDGAWGVAETSATNGEELSRFLEHYKDSGDSRADALLKSLIFRVSDI